MAGLTEDTKLYLPFDEATNGATTVDGAYEILDYGNIGYIWTQIADTILDTSTKKIGSSSLKVDGTGDVLRTPDNANLSLGSADFTFECYVNFSALPTSGNFAIHMNKWTNAGDQREYLFGLHNNAGTTSMSFSYSTDGTGPTTNTLDGDSLTLSTGIWYHFAYVRDGNTLRYFLDGVAKGTDDLTGITVFDGTGDAEIGGWLDTANRNTNGYIDEVRLSNTARYTSGFTPSTDAFTSDANTLLLLHMDTQDQSGDGGSDTYHIPDFIGTAQLDTAVTKYAGDTSSLLLDGNSDAVKLLDTPSLELGSGEFTFDTSARFSSLPASGDFMILNGKWTNTGDQRGYLFQLHNTSGNITMGLSYSTAGTGASTGELLSDTLTISTGLWYHLAWVRDGDTLRFFQNGVAVGTADMTGITVYDGTSLSYLGGWNDLTTYFMDGNMAHTRLQGTAVWTEAFTPPEEAYSVAAASGRAYMSPNTGWWG